MNADRAEAAFWATYLRNRNVDVGTADDGAVPIAGGFAICVKGTHSQRALAVGTTRPVRADDLDVLREFYERRGVAASAEVRRELFERDAGVWSDAGFTDQGADFRLYQASDVPMESPAGVTVRQTTDRRAWSRVVMAAFADSGEPDDETRRSFAFFAAAASGLFIAELDGVPAGGGAVAVAGEYAYLFCGAVLRRFRGRGVHAALVAARAAFGRTRDTTQATVKVLAGTPAERSFRKLGFASRGELRRLHHPR